MAERALDALHESMEVYMVGVIGDANLLVIHAQRVTLQPWDIQLAHRIQGSHIYWKTWKTLKNETTPGKPGKIMEFCKK